MKLEYLHKSGGSVLSAPSGSEYEFKEDSDGRRLADVQSEVDAAWFLTLTNSQGQQLFVAHGVVEAEKPVKKPRKPLSPVFTDE